MAQKFLSGIDLSASRLTYANIQTVSATDRLLGRDTAGAGTIEELTVGGGLEFTGSTGIQRSALTGAVTAAAGSNTTVVTPVTRYYPITITTPQQQANAGNTFPDVFQPNANIDLLAYYYKRQVLGRWNGFVHVPHTLGATANAGIILVWCINVTTGNVIWNVETARWADGGAVPASLTAETAITVTVPGTANMQKRTTFPASGNLGVTPVADEMLLVSITAALASTAVMEPVLLYALLRVDAT